MLTESDNRVFSTDTLQRLPHCLLVRTSLVHTSPPFVVPWTAVLHMNPNPRSTYGRYRVLLRVNVPNIFLCGPLPRGSDPRRIGSNEYP